jgi:putative membrane protein
MIRATLSVTVLSAAALLGAPALTQAAPSAPAGAVATSSAGDSGASPRLSKDDRDFFDDAAQGGLLEVKLAQHALKQAASEEVKHFAQRMIDDHTKTNQHLADAGRKGGLVMPQDLDKKHTDQLDRLTQLSGTKLDQEYVDEMVKDHKDDVKAFEREAKDGKDPALRQFAASTLPVLQEHLTLGQQLQEHLKK